ncbi:hypothetical protein IJF85_02240 [Candidatus Saccharibacteria bacterium]|nr:hypothetical protein [Candidatus Saccharibacteria bacterium]
MTKEKSNKYAVLTDQDIKIIKSDPEGLADYVIRNKVRATRKTMIIISIFAVAAAFAAGVFCGMGITRESIPNNVVQIKIGNDGEVASDINTDAEGK